MSPGSTLTRIILVHLSDYISPRLTQMMIDWGEKACFMKDKKGWLPAHVACSRHCSPEKLNMLLKVNPDAVFEETNNGETLLALAEATKTVTHPNNALIDMLKREMDRSVPPLQQPRNCSTPPAVGGHNPYFSEAGGIEDIAATGSSASLVSPLVRSGSDLSSVGSGKRVTRKRNNKRKYDEVDVNANVAAFHHPSPSDPGARLLLDFYRSGYAPPHHDAGQDSEITNHPTRIEEV